MESSKGHSRNCRLDIAEIEQELFQSNIGHMAMPSRGVAGISAYISVAGANEVAENGIVS